MNIWMKYFQSLICEPQQGIDCNDLSALHLAADRHMLNPPWNQEQVLTLVSPCWGMNQWQAAIPWRLILLQSLEARILLLGDCLLKFLDS